MGKQIAALVILKWHRHALTRCGLDRTCRRDAFKGQRESMCGRATESDP